MMKVSNPEVSLALNDQRRAGLLIMFSNGSGVERNRDLAEASPDRVERSIKLAVL
jgi:hypothetical protein